MMRSHGADSRIMERLRPRVATIFEVDEASITEKASFIGDFDADSVDFLDLVLLLQDEFGLEVGEGTALELFVEFASFSARESQATPASDPDAQDLMVFFGDLTVGSLARFIAAFHLPPS